VYDRDGRRSPGSLYAAASGSSGPGRRLRRVREPPSPMSPPASPRAASAVGKSVGPKPLKTEAPPRGCRDRTGVCWSAAPGSERLRIARVLLVKAELLGAGVATSDRIRRLDAAPSDLVGPHPAVPISAVVAPGWVPIPTSLPWRVAVRSGGSGLGGHGGRPTARRTLNPPRRIPLASSATCQQGSLATRFVLRRRLR